MQLLARLFIFLIPLLSGVVFAKLPVTSSSKSAYEAVFKTFVSTYSPILKHETGLQLIVEFDSENPDYFGGASLSDTRFIISIGKNVSDLPGMTPQAMAFVLCHEVGHVLGGSPKKQLHDGTLSWSSAEGQSDDYAARICLPKLFSTRALFQKDRKAAIIQAGQDWISVIYELIRFSGMQEPHPKTLDSTVVEHTLVGYPSLQCRLDTIVAAANNEPRPSCWFRP